MDIESDSKELTFNLEIGGKQIPLPERPSLIVQTLGGFITPQPEASEFVKREIGALNESSMFFPTFRRIEGGYTLERRRRGPRGAGYGMLQEALTDFSEALDYGNNHFVASISTHDIVSLLTSKYAETSDVRIYRRIEQSLGPNNGDVLFCNGRETLLKIYNRRNEITNCGLVFLADRDMWLFHKIPDEYNEIVWTEGYSIENDVYTGSVVENLLEGTEEQAFHDLLDKVCEWFAFEVGEFSQGRDSHQAQGIGRILNKERNGLCSQFLLERGFRTPNCELYKTIRDSYFLKLRGKTLFSLLTQILSAPKREAKHNIRGLIEVCICMKRNPDYLEKLIHSIRGKFNPQGTLPITE